MSDIIDKKEKNVKTTFVSFDIPKLSNISIERVKLDPILKDVISEQILTTYDWVQIIGTALFSISGLVVSLFSNNWTPCKKITFVVICSLLWLVFLLLPVLLKRRDRYISEVVLTINDRISCIQSFGIGYDEWRKTVVDEVEEANKEANDAIAQIKRDQKEMKRNLKKKNNRKP